MEINEDIKELLELKVSQYNNPSFIEFDPVSIPHRYSKCEDIEIAGFLAATISWGNRKAILQHAARMMEAMDDAPADFIRNHTTSERKKLQKVIHRTFNGEDCMAFAKCLQHLYLHCGGLQDAFNLPAAATLRERILHFRKLFFSTPHPSRTEKHVSDPSKKSSAKRICMFLRWMVRRDKKGVDFGIWQHISPAELCLPLDVHTGNVSRSLGLLQRKQNDWQAVEEVTAKLRELDPLDPVKYDFALFGIGVNKELR